jgi:hypothetical protein
MTIPTGSQLCVWPGQCLSVAGWVTDGLLSKVEKDPVLSKAFSDPAMAQVLAQFQANPQHTLAATKDKPEVGCIHSYELHH